MHNPFHRPARAVTLYSRPGCHLCDDARQLLATVGRRYRLSVREVDIRQDPVLLRRYDVVIPVIEVQGGETLEAPITAERLRRALAAAKNPERAR